jgi:nucleoside-diphosphate-sugar epimerase
MRPSKSEVRRLWGDNTLIRSLTDWQPQVSLRDGLQRCIDWFTDKENLKRYKTGIYNT